MGVRYQIIERIAVGGMGEVFLARQESIGGFRRTVVLKRLLPDIEGDEDMVRRFLDEARVAACLSHENVVTVLEVGDDNGPFLALEYVHGENAGALRQKARKKQIRFPVVVVARLIADAARGLAHAHEAKDADGRPLNIVHRDVSPKNIFVRSDGLSKIGDFGIAKSDHKLSKTATGAVPGTLSYMAPEQSAGDECTSASDQFSLGIVLWELLAGEPLFKAPSPQETIRNLITKPVPRPSKKREGAEPLDDIVKRMLDRDPKKRFASLTDVAGAIESALPETRAELGQKAVAAFVEAVAGEELCLRMRRIEAGPEDTVRLDRDHPVIGHERPALDGGAKSRSGDGNPSEGSWKTPSGTPLTMTQEGGTADTADVTRKDRLSKSGAPGSMPLSLAPTPRAKWTSTVLPKAAAATLVAAVAAGAVIFGYAKLHVPTDEERTAAYLKDAAVFHPELHRDVFLAMAEIQWKAAPDGAAKVKALEPVADELAALLKARLALLATKDKRKDDFLEKARALTARIPDADLATDELDMWDYDSNAPLRWLDADTPATLQAQLKDGGVDMMHTQAEMRHRSVDRLIARSGKDAKAVHAVLDPLVAEREKLIESMPAAADDQLLAIDRRIAQLNKDGEVALTKLVGPVFGKAIANVGFHFLPGPDEWQPMFGAPPSVTAAKTKGGASPELH